MIVDARGVLIYSRNSNDPNAVHPAKASINTLMGGYGVWVNPIVGITYYGIDTFYPGGWDKALKKSAEIEDMERKVTGHGFVNGMPKE